MDDFYEFVVLVLSHGFCFSISLSSMESEADESSLLDNVDGSTARLLGTESIVVGSSRRGPRGSGGGASTHSLNEADLQVGSSKRTEML